MRDILFAIISLALFTTGVVAQKVNSLHSLATSKKGSLSNRVVVKYKQSDSISWILSNLGNQRLNHRTNKLFKSLTGEEVGSIQVMESSRLQGEMLCFFTFEAKERDQRFLNDLEDLDEVEYAEFLPNYEIELTPNDPSFISQLYLETVHAEEAFELYQDASYRPMIAIVDDGVFIDHEDLADNIYQNPGEIPNNGIDDDGNGYIDDIHGYDVSGTQFSNGDPDPSPPSDRADLNTFSHGTHVAGCAAAVSDNELGIASISFNSSVILPVKTTRDEAPNPRLIEFAFEGLLFAIESGADIVNMSYGSSFYSQATQDLINLATENGIVFVAAAGNDKSSSIQFPAGYDNVIAVAATNLSDEKSSFSNYGTWVDISAPGTDILSTVFSQQNQTSGGYTNYDGTSMSSPIVAGLVGMILSQNQNYSPAGIDLLLKRTSENIDRENPRFSGLLGGGRIDAEQAILKAQENSPIADFFTNNGNVRVGQEISFINNSYGEDLTYFWFFGDGGGTSEESPTHVYTDEGIYRVSLTVQQNGVTDGVTKRVQVLALAPETPFLPVPFTLNDGGDFESNADYFKSEALEGGLDIWELGVPTNALTEVASPENVWKTDLDNDLIKSSYKCALYTPKFDLSGEDKEFIMQFRKSMESEFCDGPSAVHVEYSIDTGKNWNRLGEYNDLGGTNWYNKDPSGGCPISTFVLADQQGWIGDFSNEFTAYNVSFLAGQPSVQFRFVLTVYGEFDGAINDDGFMIDDFEILAIEPEATFVVDKDVAYPGLPLQFSYTSGGADAFIWDFGDGSASNDSDPIHAYEESGLFTVSLSIVVGDDTIASEESVEIRVLPREYLPFRLVDGGNFEQDNNSFGVFNVSGTRLERGISEVVGKNGVRSGAFGWVSGISEGLYEDLSEAYLYTPLLSFSSIGTYEISFHAKHSFEDTWDGFIIEYSSDFGLTWQQLDPEVKAGWCTTLSDSRSIFGQSVPIFSGSTNGSFVQYSNDISFLQGNEFIAFRITFLTDWAEQDIGVVFDDFEVRGPSNGPPKPLFSADYSNLCESSLVTFRDISKGSVETHSWSFGEGASPSVATGPGPHIVSYTSSGPKTIEYTITDPSGNDFTLLEEGYFTIFPNPEEAQFSLSTNEPCLGDNILVTVSDSRADQMYAYYINGVDFGVQASGNDGQLEFQVGPVQVGGENHLIISNEGNCVVEVSNETDITVRQLPTPIVTREGFLLSASESDTYQWYKNGELIPGAVSQTHTMDEAADYSVRVSVDQCYGESDEITFVTSAIEEESGNELRIYPNPTDNQLTIILGQKGSIQRLELLNLNGKVLEEISIEQFASPVIGKYEVDLSRFKAGVYIMKIEVDAHEEAYRKVILK
jgi:serine protease